MSIFYEMLSVGVGHNEEAILAYLYDRYPDMFTIYFGDYYSVICNYHKIHRDYYCIKTHFIQNLLKDTSNPLQKRLLESCYTRLVSDISDGILCIPTEEVEYVKTLVRRDRHFL